MHDGVIKIRIAAPAVENAANEALVDCVAGALGVSKRSVRIVSGFASRRKVLEIDGMTAEGENRWQALRIQAIAQGLSSAGGALRWETVRRPEALRYPPLRDGYIEKLTASYDWLERELDVDTPVDIGHIALATTLSWLEFRELPSFRENRRRLTAWFDAFELRPSMRATPMSGETHD
jgi:glutathione S-transferase